jgi:pyruvate,orthophosphate dikinase
MAAIEAVFESWSSHRATVYRERESISHDGGTAVIIQCMVFGNRNQNSGTGVIFSRDPNTGEAVAYGDFVRCAQGEAVVSGSAEDTVPIAATAGLFPVQYRQLQQALEQLEHHYRDMVDVEFTIDDGVLWILQARPGKRSPLATLRIAHDLAGDDSFRLAADEIRARLDSALIRQVAIRMADAAQSASVLARGMGVAAGLACGAIYMTQDDAEAAIERDERILYVRRETAPDDVPMMAVAEGVITAVGGAASHAAVIARAWGKPTVVGVGSMSHAEEFILLGDVRVERGEILTIDGGSGVIYRGEIDSHCTEDDAVAGLIAWAERYVN